MPAAMEHRRVVIIGSGPAGLTAALYTARANLRPLLVEGIDAGGQLMLTTMVENWPGFRNGIMGPDLMQEMRAQAERFGTEIVQGNVTAVDLQRRPFTVTVEGGTVVAADALIIATGASAKWLDIGPDRKLAGRGVSTCATCDGYFFRGRPIAVVGGGDSAMEEAIYLTRFATKVTVIHRRDTLRASKIMQDKAFANPKIEFLWNSEVIDVKDVDKGEVTGIVVRNVKTGDVAELAVDGLFIAIGHTPNTSLFKGQLELDADGYIVTHSGTKTSVPGVFAAGDVQDRVYRQAVTAAGTGCMAAIDAERYLEHLAPGPESTGVPRSAAPVTADARSGS
jgi:thioredoxin reductase (NADPH)